MFAIQLEVKEPGGVVVRTVRPFAWSVEHMLEVVDKLQRVSNFLDSRQPYDVFFRTDSTLFEVDDVGMILVSHQKPGLTACVHVTFWDGRLRGREQLCKTFADWIIQAGHYRFLWTAIPEQLKMVIAFTKRVGFLETEKKDGVVVFHYTMES